MKKTILCQYYEKDSIISVVEDTQHEFKGHRSLAVEEIPPWCYYRNNKQCAKRAVSRAINAFLT